jgi:putative Holliday junction resolvase
MRVLAVDVGARRIGLAVSDPTATLASPLKTIVRRGDRAALVAAVAREIERLRGEPDGLAVVVIGLPLTLDGRPHAGTRRVQAFAQALAAQTRLPVVFQDERLSSRDADSRLALRERDWRRRKARLDAAAAAIILQDYLDERQRGER